MNKYTSYQEAKIANPESEIYFSAAQRLGDKGFFSTKENATGFCYKCKPSEYCMTLEEFFDAGHKLVMGDSYECVFGGVITIGLDVEPSAANHRLSSDDHQYILRTKVPEDKMNEEIKIGTICSDQGMGKELLKRIGLTNFSKEIEECRKNALSAMEKRAIKDAAKKLEREDAIEWKNGDEIEVFNEDSEWIEARYVAFDGGMGYHVTFSDNGLEYALDSDIRELETEADKAKREALEIIDSGNFDVTRGETMAILDELSSAGMLKSRTQAGER